MPTKVEETDYVYKGRRSDVVVINCSVDRGAADLLRQYANGRKLGSFVSRLVHGYHERQLERQRVREGMAMVLDAEDE
jgi:hypothetical protein